jgi:hypothetical protein
MAGSVQIGSVAKTARENADRFRKTADVVDAVFEHGDALDAQAEGKAAVDARDRSRPS